MAINEELYRYYFDELREWEESINCQRPHDLLIYVLRFHLLAEHMFERIIKSALPRGDTLVSKARLSFSQKLAVVDALGIIDKKVVVSLDRLNSLRNKCAHERKLKVTLKQIDPISEPFGEKLSTAKLDPDQDPNQPELNAAVLATTFFSVRIHKELMHILLSLERPEPSRADTRK